MAIRGKIINFLNPGLKIIAKKEKKYAFLAIISGPEPQRTLLEKQLISSLKKRNEKVYMCPDLKIDHMGWKSSFNVDENFEMHSDKLRNWHYMWSKFYYLKKTKGIILAFLNTLPTCFRALIKLCFFYLVNHNKFLIYKARFFGLINSYFNRKSFYRPNIK